MSGRHGQGRRVAERPARSRAFRPLLAVGAVAVLVSAGALAVQKPAEDPTEVADVAPATQPLTNQSLLCPAGVENSPELVIGSGAPGGGGDGGLTTRSAGRDRTRNVDLVPGEVTSIQVNDPPVVVTGTRALAPGLFGARFGGRDRPAAGECTAPAGEKWFVGVGGGGLHETRLVLANPDTGPAVADVSVWSSTGELLEVDSRGLTIPGQRISELDLSELAPSRDELAIRVTITRGRIAASMSDTYTPRGGEPVTDWLPATAPPATSLILPGLPRDMAEPTLVLSNTGDAAGRVSLKLVGKSSAFAPAGVDEIRVPAGQVVTTELPASMVQLLAKEDTSLQLTSTVPVTGSLRAVVADDLLHVPAISPVGGGSAAAVPGGPDSVLVLTAASVAGRVSIDFPGADGKPVAVRLKPGISTAVPVPEQARAAIVHGKTAYVAAVRTVTTKGASLLPLRPLQLEQLIPAVRPEWP